MTFKNKAVKRKRIRIGDLSISYLINSAATPRHTIIFIHGFPFNNNTWEPQLQALPEDVTGIAIDVRGHGNSTLGHGFLSIDVFAKDLHAFINKLELQHVILCGVSMGGYIALRAHEIDASKFSGLVLSDTNSLEDSKEAKLRRFDTIQAVLKHGRRVFSINFADNVFSGKTIVNKPETIDMVKSTIRRNESRSICATLLALASRTATTDHLPNINVPTLVIRGAEDEITTKEQSDILVSKIPNATYTEIEGAAHLPNLEDPEGFNEALFAFLDTIQA